MSVVEPTKAVAFYSPGWPPGEVPNGIVSYVGILVETFAKQGRKAYVVAEGKASDSPNLPDIFLTELPFSVTSWFSEKIMSRITLLERLLKIPLMASRIAKGFELVSARHRCDLFEIEESFGTALFVQRILKVPVVVRLHGPWFLNGTALGVPKDSDFVLRNKAERRAIAAADGVTAPSRDVLDAVRHTHGLSLPDAVVIPNAAPVIPVDRRWKLHESDPDTVLFVGRFDRHKGGDIVIEAFGKIAKSCPNARLVFVGPDRGLSMESGISSDLPGYIQARLPPNIQKRVEIKGFLTSSEIEALRLNARVTVMASRYENFSLALLESLSYGCPTVASSIGGNPEILLDGKTGLLCRPDDPDSLAAKTVELLRSPALAQKVGEAAALDVSHRFSPHTVADQTWAYYEKVWARKRMTGGS